MAEFASAIVGLVAFGAMVGNNLYTLIDTLKDAPNELPALSDEVTDFRSILSQLLEAQHSKEFAHHGTIDDLRLTERNSRKILQDIELLIQNVLREKSLKARVTKVDRIRWLLHAKKAASLQTSLRTQKATISSFLTIGLLKCSARQGLVVSRLETKLDSIAASQLSLLQNQGQITAAPRSPRRFLPISEQPHLMVGSMTRCMISFRITSHVT